MAAARPRFRDRLRIERRRLFDDGAGNLEGDWDTANPVFVGAAQFMPMVGREQVEAERLSGVQPFEVTVRACKATRAVTTAMRIVRLTGPGRGEVLNITGISNPDMRRRYLAILAKTGVASG